LVGEQAHQEANQIHCYMVSEPIRFMYTRRESCDHNDFTVC